MHQHAFQIQFHIQAPVTLRNRRALKRFLAAKLAACGRTGGEVNIVFCSDESLLEINRTHLQHDYYTDIVTFELSEKGAAYLMTDIFISTDRVRDNARHWGARTATELHRVIFHGVLHVLGYRDKKKADQAQMRAMEEQWLGAYLP